MSDPQGRPAYLMYSYQNAKPVQVVVSRDVFAMGRADGNDLQILNTQISRQHAEIRRSPDGSFVLSDLGSRSGTYVNKQRVMRHVLRPGDEIALADNSVAVLRFFNQPVEAATPTVIEVLPRGRGIEQASTERISGDLKNLSAMGTEPFPPASLPSSSPSVEIRINDRQTRFLNLELLRQQLQKPEVKGTDQTLLRLSKLYEISHMLLATKTVDELADKWLEAVFSCLPAERGAVLLYQPETDDFRQIVSREAGVGKCGPIETSRTIIEQTFRENVAVLSRDAAGDLRFNMRQSIVLQKIRSALCAPISSNLRSWGVCYLMNSKAIDQFSGEDLEFLMATAREIGLVMENLQLVGHLEALVAERTAEIARQRDEIQRKNTHILDSIRYAERIQKAILPSRTRIARNFEEYFILFVPKDIVSGDFYWMQDIEGTRIVAAADCTGHGVPGALMSMIGNTLLNQIVAEKRILDPAAILENLHNGVREALGQELADSESQDGMDIALCRIEGDRLTFAGARRPLYHTVQRDGATMLEEIKGDRKSVGGVQKEEVRVFTNHELRIEPGMMVYLVSDGFADQPNPQGVKFGSRRLKEFLQGIAGLSAEEQYRVLSAELKGHQKTEVQRDDLTLVGIRVG